MLVDINGVNLLKNMLTEEGVIMAGNGVHRAGQDF